MSVSSVVDRIFEDRIMKRYGYIQMDGEKMEQFFIYQKYRGMGMARKLAKFIPKNCWLIAYPILMGSDSGLSEQQLINFYGSLGFKLVDLGKRHIGNVMIRGNVDIREIKSQTSIP